MRDDLADLPAVNSVSKLPSGQYSVAVDGPDGVVTHAFVPFDDDLPAAENRVHAAAALARGVRDAGCDDAEVNIYGQTGRAAVRVERSSEPQRAAAQYALRAFFGANPRDESVEVKLSHKGRDVKLHVDDAFDGGADR